MMRRLPTFVMKFISSRIALLVVALPLGLANQVNADSGTNPEFTEVKSLLLEHMVGGTEAVLNQAAVRGLMAELKGQAVIVDEEESVSTNQSPLVTSERVFDSEVGYMRIRRVAPGLAAAVKDGLNHLQATNKLTGLVLDLRFAKGGEYQAAAEVADLFLERELPLMNAGKGLVSSKEKDDAFRLPVVALVNHETSSAAEALAAILRHADVGLLIGTETAGRAGVTKDYQLTTGQTLRIVTAPILLGDAKAIGTNGVAPDVGVAINAADEAAYMEDPYVKLAGTSMVAEKGAGGDGAPAKRVRVTEADLVREKRGDGDLETVAGERVKSEKRAPKVTDPALARAIDLLKGLAVVRQWKL